MTAQDFFYWLQGFIELTTAGGGGKVTVGPGAAACILSHIELVPEGARGEALIEVRTLARLAAKATSVIVASDLTYEIAEVVARVFLHVIDPKAGDAAVQAELSTLHNAHLGPGTRPPNVRC